MKVNPKNRALRLFAFVTIMATLFATPVSASDITYDSSGVKVPAGITFTVDGIKFENGVSSLLVTIKSTINTNSKLLTFKDFTISGVFDGGRPISRQIQYFDGDNLNGQTFIYLLQGDITAQKLQLVISGTGTLENKSDVSYPKSFTSIISSLNAMGLEITEGTHTWSSRNDYGYYVLAKLKTGMAPFKIKVKSATLSANGVLPVALSNFMAPVLMGSDPVEIDLGISSVDPSINLTGVTLDAVFSVYTPSTVTSSVTLPAGIESIAQQNVYYDQNRNKSYINLLLKNTSKHTISLNTGDLVLVDSKTDSVKSLAAVEMDYALASITPTITANQDEFFHVTLVGTGDLTEDKTLNIQGKAVVVTPSKLEFSKVKLPSGFSFLPIDLSNLGYDSQTNKTTLFISVKNTKTDIYAPALSFANVKAATAKMNALSPYAGPRKNADKLRNDYFYEIGTFAGDVRLGKNLSLTGNVIAVPRTKYTNTATFAVNDAGIVISPFSIPPEFWKYDNKNKTTTISQNIDAGNETNSAAIYSCNLHISFNGKAIKALTTGTAFSPANSNVDVTIAILPGDLRVKGGNLVVTGNYTLQACN